MPTYSEEQVVLNPQVMGVYNKDRIISGVAAVVPLLIGAGSLIVLVLVSMRINEKDIEHLTQADQAIKSSLMRQITETRLMLEKRIDEANAELASERGYNRINQEKIAELQADIGRLYGLVGNVPLTQAEGVNNGAETKIHTQAVHDAREAQAFSSQDWWAWPEERPDARAAEQ